MTYVPMMEDPGLPSAEDAACVADLLAETVGKAEAMAYLADPPPERPERFPRRWVILPVGSALETIQDGKAHVAVCSVTEDSSSSTTWHITGKAIVRWVGYYPIAMEQPASPRFVTFARLLCLTELPVDVQVGAPVTFDDTLEAMRKLDDLLTPLRNTTLRFG